MVISLYVRLSILQFIQLFIWGSWFVTAGTYLLETLQFSGRQVGLVYGTIAIAATVSPFFLGYLADRFFAADKLLVILHILGGFLLYSLSFQTDFTWFYSILLLYTFCFIPTFSLANALCFHHLPDAKRDFPRVRVWGTIAWILVGLLIGYLRIEPTVTPIKIAAGVSFLQAIYCITLPTTPPSAQAKSNNFLSAFRGPEISQLLRDRNFQVMVLAIGLICIPSAYYYSFVNPFLNEIGVENAAGKMSLGQATEIILMLALPWFFRIWRLKTIIFVGLLCWGARYGFFMLGLNWEQEWLHMIGIALHGAAYIFAMLSAQIYLDTRVPAHLRSTAQGFFTLLTVGLGALIGAFIAGEAVSYHTLEGGLHNWYSIWQLPAWFGVVTALVFWWQFKGKDKA